MPEKWYCGGNCRHSACFLKVSNSDGSSAPVRALRERRKEKQSTVKEKFVCLLVCIQPSGLLTEEEEVSALGGAVGQQGGVLGQQAVGAGLVVLAIVVGRVTVDVNCEPRRGWTH